MSDIHEQRRDSIIYADLDAVENFGKKLPELDENSSDEDVFRHQVYHFLKATSMGASRLGSEALGNPAFVSRLATKKPNAETKRVCRAYMRGYSDLYFLLINPSPRYSRAVARWVRNLWENNLKHLMASKPKHPRGIDPTEVEVCFQKILYTDLEDYYMSKVRKNDR